MRAMDMSVSMGRYDRLYSLVGLLSRVVLG